MGRGLKVLIIGGGGREHAISAAYERSPQVEKIIVSPGNDFIAYERGVEVVTDSGANLKKRGSILDVADKYKPDIIDVAQDDALAVGSVDLLRKEGYNVFGPTRDAARIESSKVWSREFQRRHDVPQPNWVSFNDPREARDYFERVYKEQHDLVKWVKADGLAAGKGAIRAGSLEEAHAAVDEMKKFGDAGKTFLVEDNMPGEEFSGYAISDGKTWYMTKSAQDYKRANEKDEGLNTGGMGAISPARVTRGLESEIEREFIAKQINGMGEEGNPFQGILYIGGMKLDTGGIGLVEDNSRLGDPEAQVIIPGINTDYVDVVQAVIMGKLAALKIEEDNKYRVCIVGASRGYPGGYNAVKGKRIFGLEKVMKMAGISVFGCGIKVLDGKFYAEGGRLFNIVAEGENITQAREMAREAMRMVSIEGDNLHWRGDIGEKDALASLFDK